MSCKCTCDCDCVILKFVVFRNLKGQKANGENTWERAAMFVEVCAMNDALQRMEWGTLLTVGGLERGGTMIE